MPFLADMNQLSPEDRAAIESQQEMRRKVSEYIGEYLLKGYTMLGTACDNCGTVLMRDREGVEHCLAKNVPGACEDPAPTPAPAPPQPKAAAAAAAAPAGGGSIVRDVDISAYYAAGADTFAAEPPARVLSPQVQQEVDHSDEISTMTGNYLCRGYCMLATACAHCNTVLLRDRSGKEICVAQEIPGACPGGAKPAPAPAPVVAVAVAAVPAAEDDVSDADSEEEEVWARRRKELLSSAQSSAAEELQRRREVMFNGGGGGGGGGGAAAAAPAFAQPAQPAAAGGAAAGIAGAVQESRMNAARALSTELNALSQTLGASSNTFQAKMEAAQLIAAVGAAMQSLKLVN